MSSSSEFLEQVKTVAHYDRICLRNAEVHDMEMARYINAVTGLVMILDGNLIEMGQRLDSIIGRIDSLVVERDQWRGDPLTNLVIDIVRNYINGRLFGRQSDQMVDQLTAIQAQINTQAAVPADALPAYRWESQCPKCHCAGSGNTATYVDRAFDSGKGKWTAEHLLRTCGRCGYKWKEGCLS